MIISELYTNKKNYLYEGLNTESLQSVMLWESAGRQIVEAQLTSNQVLQIFQQAEQGATASGSNRTMLGKGKDAAAAVNRAWGDLKTKVQNSGPIKNVDAMYDQAAEKLKQATGGDAGVMQYVNKYRAFAKAHPISQSLIYAALIAAAGLSGAGLGGAAALGLFKMTDKLLQGEKFSSAAYQGAKTGALAYGASQVADLFRSGQPLPGAATSGPTAGLNQEQVTYLQKLGAEGNPMTVKGNTLWVERPEGMQTLTAPRGATAEQMLKVAQNTAKYSVQQAADTTTNVASNAAQATADVASNATSSGAMRNSNALLKSFAEKMGLSGANHTADMVGGVPVTIDGVAVPQELYTPDQLNNIKAAKAMSAMQSSGLKESQVNRIFALAIAAQLNEGIMDTIKGAASKAGQWAQTKGHNLTTKITADKLAQAWEKAGAPMDSDQIAAVLKAQGVTDEVIASVYGQMKLPVPAATSPAASEPDQAATAASSSQVDKLLATLSDYISQGGTITPKQRGAFVSLWKQMGGTQIAENKRKKKNSP